MPASGKGFLQVRTKDFNYVHKTVSKVLSHELRKIMGNVVLVP
jgi:hypothetical protein